MTTVALLVVAARHARGDVSAQRGETAVASVPHRAAEIIEKRLRSRPSFKTREASARSKAGPIASVAEEIAKLGKLQEAGLITEAEFAAQKAKLLDH